MARAWNTPWLWMVLVGVLFCAPLFAGLDRHDLDGDEAIYSFSIQTMVRHGDWLTPKSIPNDHEPWLEKPPLKFWIVGLPIHWGLLPDNEFGMRFWDAVMGSLAFLYVFAIGRRIAGPLCGLGAVFILFIHDPLMLDHGLRSNNMESALFLAYTAGIYHFLAWREAGPDNRTHLIAITLYFVLGFMTKFVAALFLPMVIGAAAIVTPEDRRRLWFNRRSLMGAVMIALALIAPWFIYQYAVSGRRVFDVMFSMHVMQRLTATLDPGHLHPWNYYFTELWAALRASGTAWLTLIGAALLIADTIRRRWANGLLIVLWFVIPITVMSLGTSKLYHYAYPFLPPVAIAGGYAAAKFAQWLWRLSSGLPSFNWSDRGAVRVFAVVVGTVALVVAIATSLLGQVRISVGDTVLLRNDNVIRPALVWLAAWTIGAPRYLVRAILPTAIVLLVLPGDRYRSILDRAMAIDRPVHDIAACLSTVSSARFGQGVPLPGVLVEFTASSHRYSYYLHGLGPWDVRDNLPAASIAAHLYDPASYGPVLLSPERISRFQKELRDDGRTRIGAFPHNGVVLLLPGPYAVCAPPR